MEYIETIGSVLLIRVPLLLAWGAGIGVSAALLRRGGGRAEKLFLAGACLMFFSALAGPLLLAPARWSTDAAGGTRPGAATYGLLVLLPGVFNLAGLVCLVWGFWLRFAVTQGGL
jgi:hypothetical protein